MTDHLRPKINVPGGAGWCQWRLSLELHQRGHQLLVELPLSYTSFSWLTANQKPIRISGGGFLELSMFTSTISSYIEQNDKYEQGNSAQQRQRRCHFMSQESLIGVLDDAGQHRLRLLPIWLQQDQPLLRELPLSYVSFSLFSLLLLSTANQTPTTKRTIIRTNNPAKKITLLAPVNLKKYSPPNVPADNTKIRFFVNELINCFLAFVNIFCPIESSLSRLSLKINVGLSFYD